MTAQHLKFIDSLPCVICGRNESTHHHLLRVDRKYLTPTPETSGLMFPKIKSKGMGTKSDDRFCLPVCARHHAEAHRYGNDKQYFQMNGLDEPERLALALFETEQDYDKAMDVMKWHFLGLQNSKRKNTDNNSSGSPIPATKSTRTAF
jgi:hypothetical protein